MNVSLTHTLGAADVSAVAGLAVAGVGAQSVETLAVFAQVAHHATLINIWTETRNVCSGYNKIINNKIFKVKINVLNKLSFGLI